MLNFSIIVLFLTNLWIIIYSNFVTFLNYFYPPTVKEIFYIPRAFPEPFEMPLYIIETLFLSIVVWLILRKYTLLVKLPTIIKVTTLIALSCLFLNKLGTYPYAHDYYPYLKRPFESLYTLTVLIYLAIIIFLIAQLTLIAKIFSKKKLFNIFLILLIALITAIFTFEPRFPISTYDYAHFFGPIWEVVTGKTLFVNASTDYGFVPILLLAAINKLKLFSYFQLPIYVWFMFVVLYSLCFYFIYKISRSVILASLGLFSIITLNYLSFFIVPSSVTQYSALRRLPAIIILLLLYKFKKIDSKLFLFSTSIFSFWVVDVGISNILAIGLTLFYLTLQKYLTIKKFLNSVFILLGSSGFVYFIINIFLIFFGYKFIPLQNIFTRLRLHTITGLTMLPIPAQTYFWLVILVYFAAICYFFRNYSVRNIHDRSLLLFSANLMFFHALYYVGRSDPANLFDISVLVLLTFFILLAVVWNNMKSKWLKPLGITILFILLIIFPAHMRNHTLTELLIQRYEKIKLGNIFVPEVKTQLENRFTEEKNLIKKYLAAQEILILSNDDTYILIASDKTNLLSRNPQLAIDTVSETYDAIQRASIVCPKKIAVDCRVFNKCDSFDTLVDKDFSNSQHILDIIEKKCNFNYQPLICTNKLCIARVDKL